MLTTSTKRELKSAGPQLYISESAASRKYNSSLYARDKDSQEFVSLMIQPVARMKQDGWRRHRHATSC